MIEKSIFGSYGEDTIYKYTMKNKNNIKVSCMSYGASLIEFTAPDKFKNSSNIILSFDNLKDYIDDNSMFLGNSIGPVGGRIGNGAFKIGDITYTLPKNEGKNTLHGGNHGFNTLVWNCRTIEDSNSSSLIFTKTITEKDDGFPGNRNVKISYTLNNNNDLTIRLKCKSSEDTIFNPTIHTYFNLNNDIDKLLSGHYLKINSKYFVELDKNLIPTGTLKSTDKSIMDFKEPQNMENVLQTLKQKLNRDGLDDPFKINGSCAATLVNYNNGRCIDIESDRNGLIVYTLNSIEKPVKVHGKDSCCHMGIALEPQTLPDAINHKEFGDILLSKNAQKSYSIKYHFKLL